MFATQCLQNCVYLSHQSLQHIVKSGNGQAEDPSSSLAGGGSHPSNGPKVVAAPARASVGKGSAAEAAQQMAMLSIDRSRAVSSKHNSCATSSQPICFCPDFCVMDPFLTGLCWLCAGAMDAAVAAAADRHRQEMQSIISAAFASLAWLQLQKQHWQLAKHTCEAWLTVRFHVHCVASQCIAALMMMLLYSCAVLDAAAASCMTVFVLLFNSVPSGCGYECAQPKALAHNALSAQHKHTNLDLM